MPRGGARANAGRPSKSLSAHRLAGSFKSSRHAHRTESPPATLPDWRPTSANRAELSARALAWLDAVLASHAFTELDGLRLLESLRVLSAVERLEVTGSPVAVRQERKLFVTMWSALNLEK